ncbi:(2Fe-2S)-binding protein [Silvibacterium acidisoli]|uniref:(2Fe-2S)-binding protein n=1 Tax=Acidobacteriaceae bacterium ZG23-2 TaxID=2883246 RepID=UPI00406D4FA9
MPESRLITVQVNGKAVSVPAGSMVSAAMLKAGDLCRVSVTGEPRSALCGMGICFECRAVINGVAHSRSCQVACREGMTVETQR